MFERGAGRKHGHLQASIELRRQIGFDAGVGSGLLALAELTAETWEEAEAARLLAEATDVARAAHAEGLLIAIGEAQHHSPDNRVVDPPCIALHRLKVA